MTEYTSTIFVTIITALVSALGTYKFYRVQERKQQKTEFQSLVEANRFFREEIRMDLVSAKKEITHLREELERASEEIRKLNIQLEEARGLIKQLRCELDKKENIIDGLIKKR